jgi:outer membrane protein TolC
MKKHYALIGLLWGLSWGASAQESLSLSGALQKSLAQNFNILVEKKNVEAADLMNNWGQAGRFPTINAIFGQNNNFTNVTNPAAFQQGTTISNNLLPQMTLGWTLFDGFRINITKDRFEQLEQQAEGSAQVVVENTVQTTILAYYAATLAQERLKLLEMSLELSREKYDYLLFKQQVGSAVAGDVLLERTNYLSDSAAVIGQQLAVRNAMRNLNEAMAEPDMTKMYQLTDRLQFADEAYTYADLENKMLSSNSNLRLQYVAQELLKTETALRKSEVMPQINLNMGASYNINRQDLSRAKFPDGRVRPNNTAKTLNYFGNFTVSIPIFNGGQVRRAIEQAKIQEQAGSLRLDNLKLALRRDLADALDLYNVRRSQAQIAAENRKSAEENLRLADDKFRQGTINVFEYRILQNTFLDVASGEWQAIYNFIEARTSLLRLTGGIVSQDGGKK